MWSRPCKKGRRREFPGLHETITGEDAMDEIATHSLSISLFALAWNRAGAAIGDHDDFYTAARDLVDQQRGGGV